MAKKSRIGSRQLIVTIIVCIAIALGVAGYALLTDPQPSSEPSIQTAPAEDNAGVEKSIEVRQITSQDELDRFVAESSDASQPPEVDFGSSTLSVVVYSAPTPGYGLQIASYSESSNTVALIRNTPGDGCLAPQVITPVYAYQIVSRSAGAVAVDTVTDVRGAACLQM